MNHGNANLFRGVRLCVLLVAGLLGPLVRAQTQQIITVDQARAEALTQPPDYFINLKSTFYLTYIAATSGSAAYWQVGAFSMSGNFVWTNNLTAVNVQALTTKGIEVLSSSGVRQGGGAGIVIANGLRLPVGSYQLKYTWGKDGVNCYLTRALNLTGTPVQNKRAVVPCNNPTKYPMTFKFYEGSATSPFQTVTVPPNSTVNVTLNTQSGQDIRVSAECTAELDANGNLVDGNRLIIWNAGTIYANTMQDVTNGTESGTTVAVNNTGTTPANVSGGVQTGTGTVTTPVFTNTTSTDALDKATYSQGVNGLKSGLDAINNTLASGSSATTNAKLDAINGTLTTTNTKLDDIKATVTTQTNTINGTLTDANAKLDSIKTGIDSTNTKLDALKGTDQQTALTGQKDSQTAGASSSYSAANTSGTSTASGVLPSTSNFAAPSSSSSSASVSVDLSFIANGPSSFELNPLRNSTVGAEFKGLAEWFKQFVGWAAVLGLYSYCFREIRQSLGTVLATQKQGPFAIEGALNSNIGSAVGSVAARTALIAVVAAGVLAMPSLFVQVFASSWSDTIAGFLSAMNSAKGGTGMATFFGIANDFAPLPTLFAVMVTYVTFEMGLLPVQFGAQYALRFGLL